MAEFLELLYFSCPLHASGNSHGSRTEREIVVHVAVKAYSILLCFSFPVFSPYPVLARLSLCGCDTAVLCVVALQCLWCSRMAGRWPAHRQAVGRKGERKGGDRGAKLPPPLGTFEPPTTSSHSIFTNRHFERCKKKYSGLSLPFKVETLKSVCAQTDALTVSRCGHVVLHHHLFSNPFMGPSIFSQPCEAAVVLVPPWHHLDPIFHSTKGGISQKERPRCAWLPPKSTQRITDLLIGF